MQTPTRDERFFGHPRGLATLFFTEMWERFSFYGLRALLILFMTAAVSQGGLGFDVGTAGVIYGLFTAMVYLAALPGGWVADRLIGQQRAVFYGGVLIVAGGILLTLPSSSTFYMGLAGVVMGTGLLKPNASTIVGQLYSSEDLRRDAGFSIFYMGINLGAFLAPLICGYVAYRFGWRYGFSLAGIGMTLGLIQYRLQRGYLGGAGATPAEPPTPAVWRQFLVGLAIVAALLATAVFLTSQGYVSGKAIAEASGGLLLVVVAGAFAWIFFGGTWTSEERRKLIVIFLLFCASCVFWSVFEQAGSSLNLFAERNTDNQIGDFTVPAPWYQSVNALFIIGLAPVFAALWSRLGSREPSSPAKFSLGLALVGIGFVILAGGASLAASGVRVSPAWLIVTYLFHTMGELCLSPVGLSAMTKLAPARVSSLMMGVFFLSISVGNYMGGRAAALYETFPLTLLFGWVGLFAIATGAVLALFVRPIVRLMGGVR